MTTVTFWRHLFSSGIKGYISAGWQWFGPEMQCETAIFDMKQIPKCLINGFIFYTGLSGNQSALIRAEQGEVKYFLMGISVILVLWVGTFVMMIE